MARETGLGAEVARTHHFATSRRRRGTTISAQTKFDCRHLPPPVGSSQASRSILSALASVLTRRLRIRRRAMDFVSIPAIFLAAFVSADLS